VELCHTRQNKATVVIVAFFVELRCSATPHQAEKGDGSCVAPQQEEEEGDYNAMYIV
jgi:hypothetical protein